MTRAIIALLAAMGSWLGLNGLFNSGGWGSGGTPAAPSFWQTDATVYALPALPAPIPAKGQTFVDPIFGTSIMRLTDAADGGGNISCVQEYSSGWPASNIDSTEILYHYVTAGTLWDKFAIATIDPVALTYISQYTINQLCPNGAMANISAAMWSGIYPHVLYAIAGKSLYSYDTVSKVYTLLRDFSDVMVGVGEVVARTSMSYDNDNYFTFATNITGTDYYRKWVWRRDTNQIIWNKTTGSDGKPPFYKGNTLSASGKYLSVSYEREGTNLVPLDGALCTEWWDLSVSPPVVARSLYAVAGNTYISHGDSDGAFRSGWSPNWNIFMNMDYAGSEFQYLSLMAMPDWLQADHASMSKHSNPAFIIRSSYDPESNVLESPSTGPWHNEITAMALDGSGRYRRLAHHRAFLHHTLTSAQKYWATPRGNVGQDQRIIVFTSNMENWGQDWTLVTPHNDVYVLKVPTGAY